MENFTGVSLWTAILWPVDSKSVSCKTQITAEHPDVPQVSSISTGNENEGAHRGAKWLPSARENKQRNHLLGLNNNTNVSGRCKEVQEQ